MEQTILRLTATPLPFDEDAKIFYQYDDDGNQIGEPYSHNDWIRQLMAISGVNKEMMGAHKVSGEGGN